MSNTPRTDAMIRTVMIGPSVPVWLAQKLERELAAAKAQLDDAENVIAQTSAILTGNHPGDGEGMDYEDLIPQALRHLEELNEAKAEISGLDAMLRVSRKELEEAKAEICELQKLRDGLTPAVGSAIVRANKWRECARELAKLIKLDEFRLYRTPEEIDAIARFDELEKGEK